MAAITLPHGWAPRGYQLEPYAALDRGIKRVLSVWHRRSGKDSAGINYVCLAAHRRIGNYWYLFPTARQARRALWESVDRNGRRVLDQAVPPELRDTVRNDEMFIRLKCGSTINVTGADQFDSLVGSNPVGVVMSEYAITSPLTWRYLSPILVENGGWIWFNSTPRGKNHLYDLYERNKDNPLWFCSIKSWRDTGVITQADIDEEIRSGMPAEIAAQEYECSFEALNIGVVYSREMQKARDDGRVRDVAYDPRYPVETWWDIGHRDATAIFFVQRMPHGALHVIDYHEDRGKGFPHYAGILASKGYPYSRHVGPHDLDNKIWVVDASSQMVARNFGVHFTVAPKLPKSEGIGAARTLLGRCHFDATRCHQALASLDHYHYEWDEEAKTLKSDTVHDWSSHCADALRYGAVAPADLGIVPDWARALVMPPVHIAGQTIHHMMGHNGGPPIQSSDFDPLGRWRG